MTGSPWTAASDAPEEIAATLDGVHSRTGAGRYQVFRDWVDCMVASFQRDDDAYHDTLDGYEELSADREWVAGEFADALGQLVAGQLEDQRPILGDVYERMGMQSEAFGQHFTPWNVAYATAQMQLVTADGDRADGEPLTMGDPACGSGRLLIAAAMVVEQADAIDATRADCWVAGKDVDGVCAKLAALNLVLANLPGRVVRGDTLTMDTLAIWDSRPWASPPLRMVEPTAEADPFVGVGGADQDEEASPDDGGSPGRPAVVLGDGDAEQATLAGWSG